MQTELHANHSIEEYNRGELVRAETGERQKSAEACDKGETPPDQQQVQCSSPSRSLKLAITLWVHIIVRALPIIASVVLFMWIYYLPAILMSSGPFHVAYHILYDHVRGHISVFAYFISTGLVLSHLFSLKLSKSAIYYVVIPCCLIDVVLHVIPQREALWASIGMDLSSFVAPIIGIYVIKNQTPPKEMTQQDEMNFQLITDGTPYALFKALMGVYAAVVFFFRYFFPFFMEYGFMAQAIIRLLVFPVIFFLSKLYQTAVVFHLSEAHMDRRLIINRISSLYIKYIGRIALSNLSSSGSRSTQYLLVNLFISAADVVATVTFKKRAIIGYKINAYFRNYFKKCGTICRSRKVEQFSSIEGRGDSNTVQTNPNNEASTSPESQLESYIKQSNNIRSLTMYDEIYNEVLVVVITPLLMYFVYPIYPDSSYQTISSIKEAILQVMIQVLFRFYW